MQHPWTKRFKKRWRRWLLVGLWCWMAAVTVAHAQGGWDNVDPIWEYEDDTPTIPVDIRLKLFNLDKAYHNAGDYHNDHFVKEYIRREHPNVAFGRYWVSFRARWIGFNDYLHRFQRSIFVNASSVSASGTTINIDHVQLAGTTRMVLEGLVETARDLTYYLEDDIVIQKWEIFIVRLTNLEEEFKELLN